jgi:hypothetical protein
MVEGPNKLKKRKSRKKLGKEKDLHGPWSKPGFGQ